MTFLNDGMYLPNVDTVSPVITLPVVTTHVDSGQGKKLCFRNSVLFHQLKKKKCLIDTLF